MDNISWMITIAITLRIRITIIDNNCIVVEAITSGYWIEIVLLVMVINTIITTGSTITITTSTGSTITKIDTSTW